MGFCCDLEVDVNGEETFLLDKVLPLLYFVSSFLLCGLHGCTLFNYIGLLLVVVTTVSFNVNLMDIETAPSLFIVAAMAVSDL